MAGARGTPPAGASGRPLSTRAAPASGLPRSLADLHTVASAMPVLKRAADMVVVHNTL